ncbi:hypothetical protein [Paracoccus sp. (in: a-proteobacteria)]|uniref:hypothetical protein n=1 Tax=Paracoccus sp. TaxID=267 RepID=UPI0028A66D60|nr:hypothetical protein [Paracoccus sp. (in: a-proteobacteria)]
MTISPFLHCKDPRLGIRPVAADLKDMTTRLAIRALLDCLSGLGDRAICAPAIGLPVRVLGLRIGDNSTCLLNPQIISAGPVTMSLGETTPHTGAFWRNSFRAQSLVIQGTGLGGREEQITVPEAALTSAQQAFELMNHPDPFSWMTPFHHIWLRMAETEQAGRYASVSAGLRAATINKSKTRGLRAGGGNVIEALLDNDELTGKINAMNPLVPVEPINQLLFGLLLELSGMHNIFVAASGKIDLAIAATLISPSTKVFWGGHPFPQEAINTLGLLSCFSPTSFDLTNFPDQQDIVPDLSSVILDFTSHQDVDILKKMKTTNIAKALSGSDGAMFIVCPAENQIAEEILQRYFGTLLLFESFQGGPVIYVARKSEVDGGRIRARLLTAATGIGAMSSLLSCQAGAWRLRKDGCRETL